MNEEQPAIEYLTCHCWHCDGKIEFPKHGVGQEIQCPHCSTSIVLTETEQPISNPEKGHTAMECPMCKREVDYQMSKDGIVPFCNNCNVSFLSGINPANVIHEHKMNSGVPDHLDDTKYLVNNNNDILGPFTLGQLIGIWRRGTVNASASYWTDRDKSWRQLNELKLDESDAETMNTRVFQVYDPNKSTVIGSFSMIDIIRHIKMGEITSDCWFWWTSIRYWLNFDMLKMSLAKDENIEYNLNRSLYDATQLTPPPLDRRWTEGKQLVNNISSCIISVIGIIIALFIIAFILSQ
jgi:hypothetical protein